MLTATTATPTNGTGSQNQTAKLRSKTDTVADDTDKLPSATTNTPAIEKTELPSISLLIPYPYAYQFPTSEFPISGLSAK